MRFDDSSTVVTLGVAGVAVVALLAVLVLLGRERRQRRNAEESLATAEELRRRYDTLQAVTAEGVMVQTMSGVILDMSARAASILGTDIQRAIGTKVSELPVVFVNERGLAMNPAVMLGHPGTSVLSSAPSGTASPRYVGIATSNSVGGGHTRLVQVATELVPAGHRGETAILTTLVDVTSRRNMESRLQRSENQFQVAMENAPIGIALVDLSWRVIEANASFADLLGTTAEALRGYDLAQLSLPEDREAEIVEVRKLLAGEQHRFSLEKRYLRADEQPVWIVLDVALVRNAAGAPDHFVAQVRDATESRMQAEQLAHRAMHDPLTGVANRSMLQEVLQSLLEQPGAADRVALLTCDLDGFKQINDRMGHAAGDEVLVHVTGVLRNAEAGRGTVARLGGDEFVIVIRHTDAARAVHEVAAAIHAGLHAPVRIQGRPVTVRVSIGIVLADNDTIKGGAPGLLAAADAAMYRAKAAGKGRTAIYDPTTDRAAGAGGLALDISSAIQQRELVVHYQPIVDLADGSVNGFEALIRWQHPQRGLLLPDVVLPLIEEAGLGTALATYVAREVVAFLARATDVRRWVSVNVSADQLGDGSFVTNLLADLSRHRIAPGRLVVELTETSLVSAGTRIRHELTQLRAAGVPVLLDDFGTGASPLSYLRDLPVGGVKLDMSFTSGIPGDPAAIKVVRALGAMARELAMVTIAEGIETEEQAVELRRSGWRYGQGWLYGGAAAEGSSDTSLVSRTS